MAIFSSRPRVGISRCLLGENVRYDGGHKRDGVLLQTLGEQVEWVPVCPEVEVGMGTPREPIQLVAAPDGVPSGDRRVRLVGITSGVDWTARMHEWAHKRARDLADEHLSGFVLKKDSPSCGVERVEVVEGAGTTATDGRGLFAQALIETMPGLPIGDEDRLHDPEIRARFLESVFEYQAAGGSRKRNPTASGASALRRSIRITRVIGDAASAAPDAAAAEEPLEIRLDGTPFATLMRTPGADRALAAGFLLADRVIKGPDDLGTIRHCVDADAGDRQNVLNVTLAGAAAARLPQILDARRAIVSSSSCGVCGRRSIADLLVDVRRIVPGWRVSRAVIERLPGGLRGAQQVFDETGGLHAAGLFDREGALVTSAEDVGRHNAVDKVIGAELLLDRLPLRDRLLFVSGRTSFEIVQKALLAGIPIVASVSAPSSLAIDLARDGGIALLGFVRGASFNVYTGVERIEL